MKGNNNMKVKDDQYMEVSYEELNLSEKDLGNLCSLGLKLIEDDRKTLIEYAVNQLMQDSLETVEPNTKTKQKVDNLRKYIKMRI